MTSYKKYFLVLFYFLNVYTHQGQKPAHHSLINHTTVYFENEFVPGANHYGLILCADSDMTNVLHHIKREIPGFWVENLPWDSKFFWKTLAYNEAGQALSESSIYSFRIQKKINGIYISDSRLEIKTNLYTDTSGGYILLDHARGIFDRSGKQVWSLPDLGGLVDERKLIRDMNVSPYHTITLLAGPQPVEIDFEGRVLWKAPYPMMMGNDTIIYHHDFRRHQNGHYYVLGNKKVIRKVLGKYSPDSILNEPSLLMIGDTLYKKTLHGLLLEFDEKGNLVWFWDSENYLDIKDLNYKKSAQRLPTFGTHMNAFSVNTSQTKAYVGFRDLNRIVKIDKKTKKAEYTYGEKYPSGEARVGHDLFKGQHDASITSRGSILIFNNNNSPKEGSGLSSVIEINENAKTENNLLLWKFDLNFDSLTNGKSSAAGNISELPNGNILVCAGVMPRIFEVSKSKKIIWDAFPYSKNKTDSLFNPFPQYRSHWTSQLYYYYFLAKCELNISGNGGSVFLNLDVFNTGNTEDTYLIEVISEKKDVIYSKKTRVLAANDSIKIKTRSFKTNKKNSPYAIRISSLNNTFLIKTILIK